ncbi:MAG TPA: hypothetical protein VFN50_03830 [Acidimicrobiales bacterium]|nr:hypothetical protein [Acidimicrobiales bacterium]
MADLRHDLTRTAQDFGRVAQDAAYVAVGLGVVGLQRAQVARRELAARLERQRTAADGGLSSAREQVARAWTDVDKALGQFFEAADAALDPLADRLPPQVQEAVTKARESRDHLRGYLKGQLAA